MATSQQLAHVQKLADFDIIGAGFYGVNYLIK
jgi:hypothetical protein